MIQRLAATAHEKVWGSPRTKPWFANTRERRIGEIWFAASPATPLLVKLLFTSERLSVQVHPDDAYARHHEKSSGKTEMWRILRAEPGAEVALGLRETLSLEQLREASQSGEIERLLNWVPAAPGDTFFVPAGTIHAIGGGLVLCEVQQASDVTYRLYDYGRPRELHLERSLDVARREPTGLPALGSSVTECAYFRTECSLVEGSATMTPRASNTLYIALRGEGRIAGQPFQAGEAWEAPGGGETFIVESPDAEFLITSEP